MGGTKRASLGVKYLNMTAARIKGCRGKGTPPGDLTEGTSVEKPKKRRIPGDRAALGVTRHEACYQAPSLGGGAAVATAWSGYEE